MRMKDVLQTPYIGKNRRDITLMDYKLIKGLYKRVINEYRFRRDYKIEKLTSSDETEDNKISPDNRDRNFSQLSASPMQFTLTD